MKSFKIYTVASAVCLLASASIFAQHVVPAVSLGDPIPAYQPDPNIVRVNGSSSNCCPATLGFAPCSEPSKGCACVSSKEAIVTVACAGNCKGVAPACSVAAKATPCKACDVPKLFHRAPAAAPCSTCSAPAPVAKPAPCSTCSAPAPVAAPSKSCDTCSANSQKTEYRRPILDAVKNFFSSPGHRAAPAKADVYATYAANSKTPTTAPTLAIPTQAPTVIPHAVSYQPSTQSTTPVPAALAPYSSQAPFATALPPAEVSLPPR